MYKLLIADDEPKIRETLRDYMRAKGFAVALAENGAAAVEMAASENPDVILLDVMMPETDGFQACAEIRAFSDVPVLFLTALGEERDFLNGYRHGGDDYIVKPFPLAVLHQKIVALLRRYQGADQENRLSCGGVTLDLACRTAFADGREIALPGKDFDLLALLLTHRGRAMQREQILNRIWGYDFDGDSRVVDTHIKRIRKALGEKARLIQTVVGTGYSFREDTK